MKETEIYRLTETATLDMEGIFDYTIDTYGEDQAYNYTDRLYSRFKWLAENPHFGVNRDEVEEGYLSYFQGSHTIFYREAKEGIEIIGIPHQKEDAAQHFQN